MGIYEYRDVRPNRHHSCSTCRKSMARSVGAARAVSARVANAGVAEAGGSRVGGSGGGRGGRRGGAVAVAHQAQLETQHVCGQIMIARAPMALVPDHFFSPRGGTEVLWHESHPLPGPAASESAVSGGPELERPGNGTHPSRWLIHR
jgi:hypothetical protein